MSGKINFTIETKKPSHATVPLRDKGRLTGKKPKRIGMEKEQGQACDSREVPARLYPHCVFAPIYSIKEGLGHLFSPWIDGRPLNHIFLWLLLSHSPWPWPGIIKFFLARESLVSDIPAGDGKFDKPFLQCI